MKKSKIKSSYYRRRDRQMVIDALGGSCSSCSTKEKLEIHHVIPTLRGHSRGASERVKDWKMNLETNKDNLKLLCSPCHKIQHDHTKCIHKELKEVKRYVCTDCGTMIRRDSPLVKNSGLLNTDL